MDVCASAPHLQELGRRKKPSKSSPDAAATAIAYRTHSWLAAAASVSGIIMEAAAAAAAQPKRAFNAVREMRASER